MEPYECNECGKVFCKDCITDWLKNSPNKECPNKHKFKQKKKMDKWITVALKRIFIRCPYNTCRLQYAYSSWKTHVEKCRLREKGIKY